MAGPTEEPEELVRFREEWKAEVRRNREAQQRTHAQAEPQPPTESAHTEASDAQASPPTVAHPAAHEHPRNVYVLRPTTHVSSIDPASLPPSVVKALEIYRRAVACEQRSEIDEALRLYRLAFRIEDNVSRVYEQLEYRKYLSQEGGSKPSTGSATQAPVASTGHVTRPSVDGVEQITQGVEDISVEAGVKPPVGRSVVTGTLAGLVASWPRELSFEPEDEKQPVHLRILPVEILVKVMGYLDTTTLERLAAVNRKTRVLSLDSTIWRRHAMKVYRPPQIPDDEDLSSLVKNYMGDLRRLYIEHPRVRLDGVYIAVCHYTRRGIGESAWVNVSHLITYHRYLRFYPNGQVVSLLTNEGDNPQQSISKLQLTSREKSLYIGNWRLEGTTVTISDLLEVLGDSPKYTFQMTLELRSRPLGRWNRLTFQAYETIAISDGEACLLPLKNERPFWFSKVRSFAT